jgi:hypothetical protein
VTAMIQKNGIKKKFVFQPEIMDNAVLFFSDNISSSDFLTALYIISTSCHKVPDQILIINNHVLFFMQMLLKRKENTWVLNLLNGTQMTKLFIVVMIVL